MSDPIPSSDLLLTKSEQTPPVSSVSIESSPNKPLLPFVAKLQEIRTQSRFQIHKTQSLFTVPVHPLLDETQTPVLSREEIMQMLKDMENVSSSEEANFITKSEVAVDAVRSYVRKKSKERSKLEEEYHSCQRDLFFEIDPEVQRLEQEKGLNRIVATFKKRKLGTRKSQLLARIDRLDKEMSIKKGEIQDVVRQEENIQKRRKDIFVSMIGKDIISVEQSYESFLNEILEDGKLTDEVTSKYISQVIQPEVNRIMDKENLNEEERKEKCDAFYSSLNEYISHRNQPKEDTDPLEAKLKSFLTYEGGFNELENSVATFIRGDDRRVVYTLIARIAADDLVKMKAEFLSEIPEHTARREFESAFMKAFSFHDNDLSRMYSHNNITSFQKSVTGGFMLREQKREGLPDLNVWNILKTCDSAKSIFGEEIKKIDEEAYSIVLDKSLSDTEGGYIDKLYYYPTPESIRNLVLLAAADYRNYRTVHANWCLSRLKNRSDLKDILDNALKTYPTLASARSLLESWNYNEQGSHPRISEAANDFSLSIFENTSPNERLYQITTEALTNASIIDVLIKRGVILQEIGSSVKEAEKILKVATQESWDQRRGGNKFASNIYDYSFRSNLRKNLFSLLDINPPTEECLYGIGQLKLLSEQIIGKKGNSKALEYFASHEIVNKTMNPSTSSVEAAYLFSAYEECPLLISNSGLRKEFCNGTVNQKRIEFFSNLSSAYKDCENNLADIAELVNKNLVSEERALELPLKAGSVLSSPLFSLAKEYPTLFLKSDDASEFFTFASENNLFSMDKSMDIKAGKLLLNSHTDELFNSMSFLKKFLPDNIRTMNATLSSDTPFEITKDNWQIALMVFTRSQVNLFDIPEIDEKASERINSLFQDPKVRNVCLNGIQEMWQTYLNNGKFEELPFSLNMLSTFITACRGTGVLSQIDSLCYLINSVGNSFSGKEINRTKVEIFEGLKTINERFDKEKWSNEDRTDFYNISRDIINAAPSLFTNYLNLFSLFTPSQLKDFSKDIYPVHRAKIVLLEKKDSQGNIIFNPRELVKIRKEIEEFASDLNSHEKPFEKHKDKLLEEIKLMFKDRFGIIKIPENFTTENMKSFTNVSTYLSNLHARTPEKETVLGFYLSLMLNNKWEDYRRGVEIKPQEFLTSEKSEFITKIIDQRKELNPLTAKNLGIEPSDLLEFYGLLQKETQNIAIGNVETIDIKLTNIILNLKNLEDLDLYPDSLDKQRMQLLLNWGNKKVGSVAAKIYQQLSNPNRKVEYSSEEMKVREKIDEIFKENRLELTPQTIKEHFQDGIRPQATIVNMLNFIREAQIEPEIAELRRILSPSGEVIQIFNRLGEEFKTNSGALALSQDLNYLDNIIVKREDELSSDEKSLLQAYTSEIRDEIVKLEGFYAQIKNKYSAIRQNTTVSNPLLNDRILQIDKIINAQTSLHEVTSTITNNFNFIIENIRACLSCMREGCNNDTDLTFGDMNKFYLYTQTETQHKGGSASDQLVFVEPMTRSTDLQSVQHVSSSQTIAFVLDRIYGTNTPSILENQLDTVIKKYQIIKRRFPKINLSVFVPDSSILTGGLSQEMLMDRLKAKEIPSTYETVTIDVVPSPAGDHYIEFGGDNAREAGKKSVKGLVISL